MSDRLHHQLRRLYGLGPAEAPLTLLDARQRVRTLVIGLGRGARSDDLADLWQGVQTELGLPAPAIAAGGDEGFQLWFSLAEPVPAAEAQAFLAGLQAHWLGGLKPQRVTRWPAPGEAGGDGGWRLPALLPRALDEDRWAAYVSADLAPVFEDTPWLEVPPKPDGQAELLARLETINAADWRAAQRALQGLIGTASGSEPVTPPTAVALAAAVSQGSVSAGASVGALAGPYEDPRDFLRALMNDAGAPLALRLEAAKALLGTGGA